MAAIQTALIIGGGIGGMCAAIELRKRGVHVDLVEQDPHWRVYGAGITLSGPTLRAFQQVGVFDEVVRQGHCHNGVALCRPDGVAMAELPTPSAVGSDAPGGGGIMRPVLARILSHATLASGTAVRCGTSFDHIEPVGEQVEVTFTDGRSGRYDLVVGADGLQSKVRATVFPDAPAPRYTGQGIWRAVVPRPPEIDRVHMYLSPTVKAGVTPVSEHEMYMFVTEPRESADHLAPAVWPDTLRGLLGGFGGLIGDIRDKLDMDSRIMFRPFWALLLPKPWHRGRVVLLGDAAHATTAHLASGAGIAVEDALVLADELGKASDAEAGLHAYVERRHERCRMVVENSVRLGDIELHGGSQQEHAQLMRSTMGALLAPI